MPRAKTLKEGFQGSGLSDDEISIGRLRFNEYKKVYPQLNKLSSLQLLEELVWLECLQERFKQQVGIITAPTKKIINGEEKIVSESVPSHLQESIADNLNQIMALKTKLGMFEDKEVTDAFKKLQELETKMAEYRRTHPDLFKSTCIHCGRSQYLFRRTDKCEVLNSPFVEEKALNNKPLFRVYKSGQPLTKEDVAAILGSSVDIVDWINDKYFGTHKAA